jgi:hypothetical protein
MNPEKAGPLERERNKEINKIHFLIHPGFNLVFNLSGRLSRKESHGYDPEAVRAHEDLLDRYIEKAKSLGKNELMVVILPIDRDELKSLGKDDLYFKKISELKHILGLRGIFFSDQLPAVSAENEQDFELLFESIMRMVKARGYTFTHDVESEAYGEAIDACVPIGGENLNKALQLTKRTKINPELTDQGLPLGGDKEDLDDNQYVTY